MKKDSRVYLKQILDYIHRIEAYIAGVESDQFKQNLMMQDAVIKQLENIGEAANKLRRVEPSLYKKLEFKQAVSMRHVLVHDYDQVDVNIIWATVQQDLPKLKRAVSLQLKKTA